MRSERQTKSLLMKIVLTLISLLIIGLEVFLYFYLINMVKNYNFIVVFMRIVGLICVASMFTNNLCSSYKLVWTIIILVFSFVGPVLYILLGNQRTFPKRKVKKINKYLSNYTYDNGLIEELKQKDDVGYKHVKLMNTIEECILYRIENVRFYPTIEEKFEDVITDIKNAERYIFMEYFIISSGKNLDEIIEALEEASRKRNIEIKILYDDIGSKITFNNDSIKRLKQIPNLTIKKYEPLGFNFNPAVNFRDHRKIMIIDGKIGYIGGDNIGDEYTNVINKYGKWRDNAIKIEGEAIRSLLFLFSQTWYMSSKEVIDIAQYEGVNYNNLQKNDNEKGYILPYGDGPVDENNCAYDLYLSLINNSKKYLYISTPYFVIDKEFVDNICLAAKSGIDVRILLPGIPDKKIVYRLTKSNYGKLLKAGVKIYEYTPGFNHAKNFISDDKYGVVGTINVDYRSLYLHFENGALIIDDEVVNKMKNNFLDDLNDSHEVTLEEYNKRPKIIRLLEFILRVISPIL